MAVANAATGMSAVDILTRVKELCAKQGMTRESALVVANAEARALRQRATTATTATTASTTSSSAQVPTQAQVTKVLRELSIPLDAKGKPQWSEIPGPALKLHTCGVYVHVRKAICPHCLGAMPRAEVATAPPVPPAGRDLIGLNRIPTTRETPAPAIPESPPMATTPALRPGFVLCDACHEVPISSTRPSGLCVTCENLSHTIDNSAVNSDDDIDDADDADDAGDLNIEALEALEAEQAAAAVAASTRAAKIAPVFPLNEMKNWYQLLVQYHVVNKLHFDQIVFGHILLSEIERIIKAK